jgi:hypothetical protein
MRLTPFMKAVTIAEVARRISTTTAIASGFLNSLNSAGEKQTSIFRFVSNT